MNCASISSFYLAGLERPLVRWSVGPWYFRISILSASLSPHKALRWHCGGWHCAEMIANMVADMGVDMLADMVATKVFLRPNFKPNCPNFQLSIYFLSHQNGQNTNSCCWNLSLCSWVWPCGSVSEMTGRGILRYCAAAAAYFTNYWLFIFCVVLSSNIQSYKYWSVFQLHTALCHLKLMFWMQIV